MPAKQTVAAVVKANLAGKPPELKEAVRRLRALIKTSVPGGRETVNPWGLLAFDAGGPFAALLAASRHVSLVFSRGTSLPDPGKLLEGTGKNLRHVKLREPMDVDRPALAALIKAAAALNARAPAPVMGSTKLKPAAAINAKKAAPTR